MPTIRGALSPVAVAAVVALAALAGCESPPPPPPPPPAIVEAPPPPPLPPPPLIAPPKALASRVIEDASAFRAYMTSTSGISPDFKDPDQVAAGVRTASAFEQNQLQQGAV